MRVVRALQERTGRDHRVRSAQLHPVPDPARPHPRDRGDLARREPQAHRRLPARPRAHDPQPAGELGEDGPRGGDREPALGGQRPRRHADGGEHLAHGRLPARGAAGAAAADRRRARGGPAARPSGRPSTRSSRRTDVRFRTLALESQDAGLCCGGRSRSRRSGPRYGRTKTWAKQSHRAKAPRPVCRLAQQRAPSTPERESPREIERRAMEQLYGEPPPPSCAPSSARRAAARVADGDRSRAI